MFSSWQLWSAVESSSKFAFESCKVVHNHVFVNISSGEEFHEFSLEWTGLVTPNVVHASDHDTIGNGQSVSCCVLTAMSLHVCTEQLEERNASLLPFFAQCCVVSFGGLASLGGVQENSQDDAGAAVKDVDEAVNDHIAVVGGEWVLREVHVVLGSNSSEKCH